MPACRDEVRIVVLATARDRKDVIDVRGTHAERKLQMAEVRIGEHPPPTVPADETIALEHRRALPASKRLCADKYRPILGDKEPSGSLFVASHIPPIVDRLEYNSLSTIGKSVH